MMEKLKTYIPTLQSRWWTGLLGISLMLNLAVGGAIVGRNLRHGSFQDGVQTSFGQLVPRHFIESLPRDRRGELMSFLQQNRQDMRAVRQGFDGKMLLLASALEAPNYDAASVKSIVESVTTGNESLAARGANVVIELVAKLSPDERKVLAMTIRDRGHIRR